MNCDFTSSWSLSFKSAWHKGYTAYWGYFNWFFICLIIHELNHFVWDSSDSPSLVHYGLWPSNLLSLYHVEVTGTRPSTWRPPSTLLIVIKLVMAAEVHCFRVWVLHFKVLCFGVQLCYFIVAASTTGRVASGWSGESGDVVLCWDKLKSILPCPKWLLADIIGRRLNLFELEPCICHFNCDPLKYGKRFRALQC